MFLFQKAPGSTTNPAGAAATTQDNNAAYSFELQFYLGPAGTGAPVHFHGHAINTLAYGEKVSNCFLR